MFTQVLIPDSKKEMEYIVTAEINSVHPEIDLRPGPYYFIQEAKKGTGKKIQKANFKKGRFYNHEDVIVA